LLQGLPTAHSARRDGSLYTITAREPHTILPALLDLVRATGATLAGLTTRSATLEDVFVTLTGRHLRDNEGGTT
jgi:ABC-2 type transport system ATP-binding protein